MNKIIFLMLCIVDDVKTIFPQKNEYIYIPDMGVTPIDNSATSSEFHHF